MAEASTPDVIRTQQPVILLRVKDPRSSQLPELEFVDEVDEQSFVFHLWEDVSVVSATEMSDSPTQGGGSSGNVTRKMPRTMQFRVRPSEDVRVETAMPQADHQDELTMREQANLLEAMEGAKVKATASRLDTPEEGTLKGIVRRVEIRDSGEWVNMIDAVDVEIQELSRGERGQVELGTMKVPPQARDPGADKQDTPSWTDLSKKERRLISGTYSGSGDNLCFVQSTEETFWDDVGEAAGWTEESVTEGPSRVAKRAKEEDDLGPALSNMASEVGGFLEGVKDEAAQRVSRGGVDVTTFESRQALVKIATPPLSPAQVQEVKDAVRAGEIPEDKRVKKKPPTTDLGPNRSKILHVEVGELTKLGIFQVRKFGECE